MPEQGIVYTVCLIIPKNNKFKPEFYKHFPKF